MNTTFLSDDGRLSFRNGHWYAGSAATGEQEITATHAVLTDHKGSPVVPIVWSEPRDGTGLHTAENGYRCQGDPTCPCQLVQPV